MDPQFLMMLQHTQPEEIMYIKNLTRDMTPDQQMQFMSLYQGRRKDQQSIIIFACLGFVGLSGVHRLVLGQMGMGILYLFTGGICMIGTIVDLVNSQKLVNEYNLRQANEVTNIMRALG